MRGDFWRYPGIAGAIGTKAIPSHRFGHKQLCPHRDSTPSGRVVSRVLCPLPTGKVGNEVRPSICSPHYCRAATEVFSFHRIGFATGACRHARSFVADNGKLPLLILTKTLFTFPHLPPAGTQTYADYRRHIPRESTCSSALFRDLAEGKMSSIVSVALSLGFVRWPGPTCRNFEISSGADCSRSPLAIILVPLEAEMLGLSSPAYARAASLPS